jgi:hypothetical protein
LDFSALLKELYGISFGIRKYENFRFLKLQKVFKIAKNIFENVFENF